MPVNSEDEKNKEAYEVGDLIHSAANIVEQAIRMEDLDSKKALQAAAEGDRPPGRERRDCGRRRRGGLRW